MEAAVLAELTMAASLLAAESATDASLAALEAVSAALWASAAAELAAALAEEATLAAEEIAELSLYFLAKLSTSL